MVWGVHTPGTCHSAHIPICPVSLWSVGAHGSARGEISFWLCSALRIEGGCDYRNGVDWQKRKIIVSKCSRAQPGQFNSQGRSAC